MSGPRALQDLPSLTALAEARAAGRPLVVGQLGQSLDGRIATATGHSHYINGDEAITVLHRLRATVDAVMVGAGTALADDPQLTVRRCEGTNPVRVLIDRRRRAGAGLRMLADNGARRVVFGPRLADDPPGIDYCTVPESVRFIAPPAIVAALTQLGLSQVLVEGGAATVSRFLAAGALDRLCVLVAPLIIGSGPMGVNLPRIDRLDGALRPPTTTMTLSDGDVVFDCDLTHS